MQLSQTYRQLADGSSEERTDSVFRAAIDAFAATSRPSLDTVRKLEVLSSALFPKLGVDTKRYAAAALSSLPRAPHGLLLRLAAEEESIAAPILLRSPLLTSQDLLDILHRGGAGHARIVARRDNLPDSIARRLGRFLGTEEERATLRRPPEDRLTLDTARDHLRRAMAANETSPDVGSEPAISAGPEPTDRAPLEAVNDTEAMAAANARAEERYEVMIAPPGLRDAALADDPAHFLTAFADCLRIDESVAGEIVAAEGSHHLLTALRCLDLSVSEAFIIAAALKPDMVANKRRMRLFTQRYAGLSMELAQDRLECWQERSAARRAENRPEPGSSIEDEPTADHEDFFEHRKAS